jgi:hypothetical protein
MDKTTVINAKNNNRDNVYRLAKKTPEFNAAYGLWILSFRRHAIAPKKHNINPRYFEFYCVILLARLQKLQQCLGIVIRIILAVALKVLQEWLRRTTANILYCNKIKP